MSGVADDPFLSLSDAVPALVWIADAEGRWIHANERWREFLGHDPARLLGDGWRAAVHPDDLPELVEAQSRGLADGAGFDVEHRLAVSGGGHRWVLSRAVPRHGPEGEVTGYVGVCVDIHEQRRVADDLARSESLLDTIVQCAPVGFALFDRDMRFIRVNQALTEINGMDEEAHIGRSVLETLPRVSAEHVSECFRRVLEDGTAYADVEMSGETPAMPGQLRHWLVSWYPVREDGVIVAVGAFVTEITDRVRAEREIELLAKVGEALDATLGVEERLARLADLVVPSLADFCTIETVGATGRPRVVASAQVGEGGEERLARLRERAGGEAVDGDGMVIPLRSRGRTLGSMALALGPAGRRYGPGDHAVARQLARRASLAVDNARLFEEQRDIAATLQQSLLPRELPEIPGLELAARFSPMGDGHEVGGDFYDVFSAGESWALVIGDVCGKGAPAAALTSLVRHTVHTLSRHDPPPSQVLSDLNAELVREQDDEHRFSTAAYVRLIRARGTVMATSSSAGHPLPLVVRASGEVEELGAPGTLLGLLPSVRVTDGSTELGSGDALVLVTDGVIEARRDGDIFGDERLRRLLETQADRPAAELARTIEAAVVSFHRGPLSDDMAVLVARVLQDGAAAP